MEERPIVVVGSINIDLVAYVDSLPSAGETLLGTDFQTHPGGKGANQAAAVGRLGYPVSMIGRTGSDDFSVLLRKHLSGAGVDISAITSSEGASGVALIAVASQGENSIIVIPGANASLSSEDINAHIELIRSASLVMTQLEIPLPTIEYLAAICDQEKVPFMLDPAPAQKLSDKILSKITWMTPNETEARALTDVTGPMTSESELQKIAGQLLRLGTRNVLLKLGERGSYLATHEGLRALVPSCPVTAIDTTAAGDAFNAAFAVSLARGSFPLEAAQFASAAAAISVTRHGALSSMPTQAEVDSFLSKRHS